MSGGLSIGGDTSGSVLLYPTPVAGATTYTLAANSGTINPGAPLIRASGTSTQSVSSGTFNVVQLPSKMFDTNNCFNNTGSTVTLNGLSVPAYSFCPNVAGYYQLNGYIIIQGTITRYILSFYKNGNQYSRPVDITYSTSYVYYTGSDLIYLNGTGDYVNLQAYVVGSGLSIYTPTLVNGEAPSFSAAWVRGA